MRHKNEIFNIIYLSHHLIISQIMGTSSLTYIYDSEGEIIIIMYRQYDGYLSGHGSDLADFLKNYLSYLSGKPIVMEILAESLFYYFEDRQEYIKQVSLNDPYYWDYTDYQYHIFSDRVNIVGLNNDDKESCSASFHKGKEVDWRTNAFKKFCFGQSDSEEEEEEEEEESEEEKESEQKEYNEDFGKVDWERWPIDNEDDNFGKVNWENIKSLEKWINPEDGYCEVFKYDDMTFFRDSKDYLWDNKDDKADCIVGLFNRDTEMIDIINTNEIEYE